MTDINKELMPCPFCGGEAIITRVGIDSDPESILNGKYIIGCDGTNGSLCPGYVYKCSPLYMSKELAIRMWNNRKETSTQDGINLYIYPVYNANHEIVKYKLYSDDCTKPIRKWNYVGNIVVKEEINNGK